MLGKGLIMYANLQKLANARSYMTGTLHVVVMRPHGLSVVSMRVAQFAGYTII